MSELDRRRLDGRLAAWLILVGALAALAYGNRAAEGKPDRNTVYHYGFAVGGLVQYGILLGIVLLIARGDVRGSLALRRPRSWTRALGLALGVLVGVYVLDLILEPFLNPGREQGLTPTGWDASRAGAFVASFVVIAIVGPIVEETMFRGLGYSLLARFGDAVAIVAVGLAFGLVHGLVDALPILAVFGMGLTYLRARADSIYPCILVHAFFNAIALIVSVTT